MSPLLEVRRLTKQFTARRSWLKRPAVVTAVDDVSFAVAEGETFGLVGESGSGKTTTARCILRLIEPTSGEVRLRGENLLEFGADRLRAARRDLQIVFQDPYSSLNPRMRIGAIVQEPLDVHGIGTGTERRERVETLLALVGLEPSWTDRLPRELSGGQRQRVGVARALALEPSVVIADEPVSALDVSVQAQIVNLLMDIQDRLKLTYLFIAHDLRVVERVCTRVAVMYRGRILEMAPTNAIFSSPRHPYTRALLSAVPVPDPSARRERIPVDESAFDRMASLREVEPGHWAAV